jgi:hypothetical protein
MSPTRQRTLDTEQTQGALRALEIGPPPAANEPIIPVLRPADSEGDMRPARGIAVSVALGAALWAAVGLLVWISVR